MRLSWPMPRRTSLMSAPIRSHRLAISLMKLILVDSSALATYLVISALSGDMTRNGFSVRRNGAYSSCSTSPTSCAAHADHDAVGLHEVVDRRAFLEELGIAGHVAVAAGVLLAAARRSCAFVPTGTVLLVTTIASGRRCGAMLSTTRPEGRQVGRAVVALRRADREVDDLAPRDRRRQIGREVQPLGRLRCRATISARPGS